MLVDEDNETELQMEIVKGSIPSDPLVNISIKGWNVEVTPFGPVTVQCRLSELRRMLEECERHPGKRGT